MIRPLAFNPNVEETFLELLDFQLEGIEILLSWETGTIGLSHDNKIIINPDIWESSNQEEKMKFLEQLKKSLQL